MFSNYYDESYIKQLLPVLWALCWRNASLLNQGNIHINQPSNNCIMGRQWWLEWAKIPLSRSAGFVEGVTSVS